MRENLNKASLEIAEALPEFYVPYASYVIQTRALPDVRDGLKTGARFILYAQYVNKITYKNKRRKGTATKSAAMMFSPHGDAAIYGTAVRMSQDFSYRYPLVDAHGNNGSIMNNNDYAADRYLEMRSGPIADEMTRLLPKETIDKWKLNYTEEQEYPTYFPTTFPNLLVNGNFGIGVSLASSIPPHNLVDVSNALITYIDNPNASFDDLYCPIDFPTGGIIINEKEVKESLKNGYGQAAVVRSVVDYDANHNELIVRELPYMVFTANATESIQKAIDEGKITGVDSVYDGTDADGVKITIKLARGANPERVLKLLYKHTFLQTSFSINMNALDNGSQPKMFGWIDLIKSYIEHLKNIIRKSYEFDLKQLCARIHILEGLILAILHIEEVIDIIKNAPTAAEAGNRLIQKFSFSDKQVEAILGLKLSRLANLELQKLQKEKEEKLVEKEKIEFILNNEDAFNKEIKKEIERIKKTYGDERKTKQLSLDFNSTVEDAEPVEEKQLIITYTNLGNLYTQESTTLLRTRRGTKGTRIKLGTHEVVDQVITDNNLTSLLLFTNKGKMYQIPTWDLPIGKINVNNLFEFEAGEVPTALTTMSKSDNSYVIFITKKGYIKKTETKFYLTGRAKGTKAITLKDGDEVVSVFCAHDENVGILTNKGNFIKIDTAEITPIGKVAMGVVAIKLAPDDFVIDAKKITSKDKYLITLSRACLIKKTAIQEFPLCNRATKGKKVSEVRSGDSIVKFLTLDADCDIIITTEKKNIKISTNELRETSRAAQGVKATSCDENDKARDIKKVIE